MEIKIMKSLASRTLITATLILALLAAGFAATDAGPGKEQDQAAGVGGLTLYFPFINNGDDLLTTFILFNRTPLSTTGTISFNDDSGAPLALAINGEPPRSSITFSLPPHGRIDFATNATGDLQTGSARVTSTGTIGGSSLFGHSFFCPSGIGPSPAVAAFGTPVRNQGGTTTLFSIMNVDALPSLLQFELYNNDGTPAGTANAALPANGRIQRSLSAFFPDVKDFQGSVMVTALGGRVAAVAVDVNGDASMFLMLPITPIGIIF